MCRQPRFEPALQRLHVGHRQQVSAGEAQVPLGRAGQRGEQGCVVGRRGVIVVVGREQPQLHTRQPRRQHRRRHGRHLVVEVRRHHRGHAAHPRIHCRQQQRHLCAHAVAGGMHARGIEARLQREPVQQHAVVLDGLDDQAFVGLALAPQVQAAQQLARDQRPLGVLAVAVGARIERHHGVAGLQGAGGQQVGVLDRRAPLELGLPPAPLRAAHGVQREQHRPAWRRHGGQRRVRGLDEAAQHHRTIEAGEAQRLRPRRRAGHRHRLRSAELQERHRRASRPVRV
jgi:hypothetical protein